MQKLASPPVERALSIDATRGTAMLFVCLSHFGLFYFGETSRASGLLWTYRLGLVATPTFILLSGLLMGSLLQGATAKIEQLRLKLTDRGLFLLCAGHALILLAHLPSTGSEGTPWRWFFITDVVGFCLLAGPWVAQRWNMTQRLCAALVLYTASWTVHLLWQPDSAVGLLVADVLVSGPNRLRIDHIFPLLPWAALYLLGLGLGDRFPRWRAQGQLKKRLLTFGSAGPVAGALIRAMGFLARRRVPFLHGRSLQSFLSHGQKFPPGPVYLVTFAGVGLLLLALFIHLEERERARALIGLLAKTGQSSFFIFVAQYYVYYVGFFFLKLPYSPFWPLYFLFSLALLTGAGLLWQRHGLNRYLTVGYPWRRQKQEAVEFPAFSFPAPAPPFSLRLNAPPLAASPRISVVIATYQRARPLQRLLECLEKQRLPADQWEVVVCVDGSTDDTVHVLEMWARKPWMPLIYLRQDNAGQSRARHRAIELARGERVIVLDDDMEPGPDFLSAHLEAAAACPSTGVVIGKVLPEPGWEKKPLYEAVREHHMLSLHERLERGQQQPSATAFVTQNVSFPKQLYLDVGGFDATLRLDEDRELGMRLERAGGTLLFGPAAWATHRSDIGSYAVWEKRQREYGSLSVRIWEKHQRGELLHPLRNFVAGSRANRLAVILLSRAEGSTRVGSFVLRVLGTLLQRCGLFWLALATHKAILAVQFHAGVRQTLGSWQALRELEASYQRSENRAREPTGRGRTL